MPLRHRRETPLIDDGGWISILVDVVAEPDTPVDLTKKL